MFGPFGLLVGLLSDRVDESTVEKCPDCFMKKPKGAPVCYHCGRREIPPKESFVPDPQKLADFISKHPV